jgi:Na+-transporting NADH:ubiquinone oxidoreductase subunit NqrC
MVTKRRTDGAILKRLPGHRRGKASACRRRGTILVIVLVCLILAATLSGVLIRRLVQEQRQLRRHEDQIQAFWLVESAVDRADAQRLRSSGYMGEVWEIAAGQLNDRQTASVKIEVQETDGDLGDTVALELAFETDDGQYHRQRTVRLRRTNSGDG